MIGSPTVHSDVTPGRWNPGSKLFIPWCPYIWGEATEQTCEKTLWKTIVTDPLWLTLDIPAITALKWTSSLCNSEHIASGKPFQSLTKRQPLTFKMDRVFHGFSIVLTCLHSFHGFSIASEEIHLRSDPKKPGFFLTATSLALRTQRPSRCQSTRLTVPHQNGDVLQKWQYIHLEPAKKLMTSWFHPQKMEEFEPSQHAVDFEASRWLCPESANNRSSLGYMLMKYVRHFPN